MHKYIIMGPQGCGKGTQAKRLAQRLSIEHISVGDLFRWHVQQKTELGSRVQRIMQAGRLVDDETVFEVLKSRLDELGPEEGFILDGFPRNVEQAKMFLGHYDMDAVIHLCVPDEVVFRRVLGRRVCSACGADFHIDFAPPKQEGICDQCGGVLEARADDNEESLRNRLADFSSKTEPTIDLFKQAHNVIELDGTLPVAEVEQALIQALGLQATA